MDENQPIGNIAKVFGVYPKLMLIDLSENNIIGIIPIEICNASALQVLRLSRNNLRGTVPECLGHFSSNLSVLNHMDGNQLTRNVVEVFCVYPKLMFIDLSYNNIIGIIPLEICNASVLQVLDFSDNNLRGTVLECLGHFSSNLSVLNLRQNKFHGAIPGSFAKGNQLRNLNFNGNGFEGPVPRTLVHCRMLEVLDLGNNKVIDSFPYWLLQVLVLRSNKFYGFVRDSQVKNSFSKLRILDLSNNNFSGFLPEEYFTSLQAMMNIDEAKSKLEYVGNSYYQVSITMTIKGHKVEILKILKIFTTIDFSNNSFCVQIPESLGRLRSLHLMDISHNLLTGHIPSLLGNLTTLESLDLSLNRLVGEIPKRLASLNFLEVLNLSKNQLSGPIPQRNQFNTFGNDSYGDNLRLCGFPLSNECHRDRLSQPSPMSKDGAKFEYRFGWHVVLIGYGCRIVVGMSMGYLVFSTEKPHSLVRIVERENTRKVRKLKIKQKGRRN